MHTIWRVQPQAQVKGADAEPDRGQSLQIADRGAQLVLLVFFNFYLINYI